MTSEIVLYRGEAARQSHKELFALPDSCYVPLGEDVTAAVLDSAGEGVTKLHVLSGWEDMLRVALWSVGRPQRREVLELLKKSSAAESDLAPFRDADINDIFPSLYYGKRFDVLRKVCQAARSRAEGKIGRRNLLVYCHLVPDDVGRIVASNL